MLEIAHSSVLEEYYTGWAPIMSIKTFLPFWSKPEDVQFVCLSSSVFNCQFDSEKLEWFLELNSS